MAADFHDPADEAVGVDHRHAAPETVRRAGADEQRPDIGTAGIGDDGRRQMPALDAAARVGKGAQPLVLLLQRGQFLKRDPQTLDFLHQLRIALAHRGVGFEGVEPVSRCMEGRRNGFDDGREQIGHAGSDFMRDGRSDPVDGDQRPGDKDHENDGEAARPHAQAGQQVAASNRTAAAPWLSSPSARHLSLPAPAPSGRRDEDRLETA